jgi:signal transduction histidine kinase/CheY-like chemotaxis protein
MEKYSNNDIRYYQAFNRLLVDCTSVIIQSDAGNFSSCLDEVLAKIGEFAGVDRSYYFHFNPTRELASNTNEWCKVGVEPQKEFLQDLSIDLFPNWMQEIEKGNEIYIDDLDHLDPSWAPEREILEPQGIKSLLVIPVRESAVLYGFIGFDAVEDWIEWTEESRQLLRILADNIGSVIRRDIQQHELSLKTKQAEELAERANAASKAKSDFLANMSHELRTPLNGVIGFGQLLAETHMDTIQQQYVQNLNESAKSLMDLINQILDFSKIEAGKMKLNLESIDIWRLVENAMVLVRPMALRKGIQIWMKISPELPRNIVSDPVRLKQVLVNLLANAVKFTDRGQVVLALNVLQEEGDQITIHFSVLDTGIGIAESDQQFLFTAFGQLDTSTTKKYGGSGLGLVISNHLLGMMNSQLHLNSQLGIGSEFYFTLSTSTDGTRVIPKQTSAWGKHIGVVSSCPDFLKAVSQLEFLLNIQLHVFHSPSDLVLNSAAIPPLEVIILKEEDKGDLGLSLVRQLRTSDFPGLSAVPILLYNHHEGSDYYQQCQEFTFVKPLLLPVLPSEMELAILEILDASQVTNTLEVAQLDTPAKEHSGKAGNAILIVEDNELNLILTRVLVSQINPSWEILVARSGAEALESLKGEVPLLILMDIQMAGMDGRQTTEIIRKELQLSLPIIACTANAVGDEREKCLAVGMNDFVTKPIVKEQLKSVMGKYIVI